MSALFLVARVGVDVIVVVFVHVIVTIVSVVITVLLLFFHDSQSPILTPRECNFGTLILFTDLLS